VHHGRIVKRTGDGAIIEFRSVVDAVRCAIEVQNGLIERNTGLPPEKRIEYRVGIHLGDVVEEEDGDLMGDGVNIASRLQGVAKPGGICISDDAYRQVKSRLDLKVSDLGSVPLKNIAEPMRAYALEVGTRSVPLADQAKPAFNRRRSFPLLAAALAALVLLAVASGWYILNGRAPKPAEAAHLSIVVLPFANLSGDPSQDYFADGVTENLTTELSSRIRNSFVIARNTAFTYKGKNVDAKEIGKELGVRYVLEGSVQRDQNRVRVNAQLIDTESGAHLWADRFDEDVADLFKLQDQIVARLTNTLGFELVKAEAAKGARSNSPDAVDLTMRGRALKRTTKDENNAARALFENALKIDPNDSDALAGDAATYIDEYFDWSRNAATDYNAKILDQADQAIALAPDNVAAYEVKSWYLSATHRSDEALRAIDAGLAINPNVASLYAERAWPEINLGRFEQAKSDEQRAMQLSPRDPDIGGWHLALGSADLGLGHFDAAIEEFHKTDNGGCCDVASLVSLAAAYALEGKMDEAKSALAGARRIEPKLTVKWLLAQQTPNLPPLYEGLRKAGIPEE
jgi:adenylate cyclase